MQQDRKDFYISNFQYVCFVYFANTFCSTRDTIYL